MTKFREAAPTEFAAIKITATADFQTAIKKTAAGEISKIDLPKSNVLKYYLADGSWIAVRPSGTEPKIKFYIGTQADKQAEAVAKRTAFEKALQQFAAE
jgi:phosphoglucomutase